MHDNINNSLKRNSIIPRFVCNKYNLTLVIFVYFKYKRKTHLDIECIK